MAWFVAALSAVISLVAVFKSHNDEVSGYIANLYSMHSWIGSLIILFYILQFFMGAYAFWFSDQPSLKAAVLQFHVVAGPILYFSVAGNILLGIQEKEGFVGKCRALNEERSCAIHLFVIILNASFLLRIIHFRLFLRC